MTEPRFRTLAPSEYSRAQQDLAAKLAQSPRGSVRGPYLPLIHSPELADRMRHLGDFIRFEGVLPPRLKEIVILLVARHWSAQYMFAVHRAQSAALGIDRAIPDAIAAGRRPEGLSSAEQAACALAEDLLRTGAAGDAAFAAARAHFDEQAVIELVAFVGYYTALAMILNTARVAPPEGSPPLPPLPR